MSVSVTGLAAATLALAASAPPPGGASVAVSTYLRAGAGPGAAAIDELVHGAPVTVRSCTGGWCRVSTASAEGYVAQEAIAPPPTATPALTAGSCVAAPRSGDGGASTRFCPAGR